LKIVGDASERALIEQWLSEIVGSKVKSDCQGIVSNDFNSPEKFQEFGDWLSEIIGSDKTVTLQIGPTAFGGKFKDGIVTIDPVFKNPNQKELSYSAGLKNPYYTAKGMVTHELMGHALDWVRGGPGSISGLSSRAKAKYEAVAKERINKLRKIYNLPLRY